MKYLKLILIEPDSEKPETPQTGFSGVGCRVESPEDIIEMSGRLARTLSNTARLFPWELPVTEWTLDRKK